MLFAFVLLAGSALLAVSRLMPERSALERATAASLLFPALTIGLVEGLSPFGLLAPIPFLVGAGTLLLASLALAGDDGRDLLVGDALALRETLGSVARRPIWLAASLVGLASIALALLSAYLLVPWSWDGLGYHLPFVFDALSAGTMRPIPSGAHYVNTYPHLGDVFLIGLRLSLLDGTFLEIGQLCFVPLLVLSIALWARRAGVPTARGLALGMLVLAMPALALQLCANYVDVIYAALAVAAFAYAAGPIEPVSLGCFALAAGLALGTKPSAPVLVAIACLMVLVRAWRRRRIGEAILAVAGVLAIGSWKYVENLAVHGNPIFPVRFHLGPIAFEGPATMDELASMGLRPPMRDHGWAMRLFESWTTVFPERYVYDMRVGGFGPLFAIALLPAALATMVAAARSAAFRARMRYVAFPVVLLSIATLASPGAYWARYTFAVPAGLVVVALAATELLPAQARRIGDGITTLAALVGLVLAYPGYTAGGPPLFSLVGMSASEREHAFGLDEYEGRFADARALVRRGEAFGYDPGFGLSGRLYPLDGRARVVFLGEDLTSADALVRFVDDQHVRVIALTEAPVRVHADLARARPDRFRWLFLYPDADGAPCSLFEVLPPPLAAAPSTLPSP